MKNILLVNPFSSSKYLSNRFKELEVVTTALYTVDFTTIPSYIVPSNDLFNEQIKYQSENVADIINKLGQRKFDYIINGSELSVKLSDKLAQLYTPQYANDPASSVFRSDKSKMHHALSKKGLSHIHQIVYEITPELPHIEDFDINYPCFIKPLFAAASIGANKIRNTQELKSYFSHSEQYHNFLQNKQNQNRFLIAEYIEGQEILVDTFSINGEHHISTIQRYHKEKFNGRPIYQYCELESDLQIIKHVESYIKKVLDTTEFKNGFAHSELFLLSNGDIKLIEINARVSGASGAINKISLLSSGIDQITLLMKYLYKIEEPIHKYNKHYRLLFLFNLSGKPLCNLKENLKKYSTVHEVMQLIPDGNIILSADEITLSHTAAFVILNSDDPKEIDNETKKILSQDKIGWI